MKAESAAANPGHAAPRRGGRRKEDLHASIGGKVTAYKGDAFFSANR